MTSIVTRAARRGCNPLALALLLLTCFPGSADAQRAPDKRAWTMLVYGAADNNADGPILEFLDTVRKALDDDPGIELLLLIDRSERFSNDRKILGENFTGTRLYRLRKNSAERLSGGAAFPQITLEQDVELDSADAANLGRFIAWGKATAPAERYGLLIYSHANGRTMCPDEQSRREMGIAELSEKIGPEGKVDFLALELCQMSGIEVAYQWRPGSGRFGADILLAIPNAGPPLDWARAFARIRTPGHDPDAMRPPLNPSTMSAADFGRLVIEEGLEGRLTAARFGEESKEEAAACLDLHAAADVKLAVDRLSRALAVSEAKDEFLRVRKAAINYTRGGPYVDLFDLCRRAAAEERLPEAVRKAGAECAESVDRLVLASFGLSAYNGFDPGRSGVFIVFPDGDWKDFDWYTPGAADGANFGRWEFLRDTAPAGPPAVDTWYELLQLWFTRSARPAGG